MPAVSTLQYYVEETTDGDSAVVSGPHPTKAIAENDKHRLAKEYGDGVTLRVVSRREGGA